MFLRDHVGHRKFYGLYVAGSYPDRQCSRGAPRLLLYVSMFYVYVLESESSGKWYIGYSNDLRARLKKHNQNGNTSTSNRGPWKLIYYEAYLAKNDAVGREKFLKSGSGWQFLKKQMRHYLDSK